MDDDVERKIKDITFLLERNPKSVVEVNEINSSNLGFYELAFENNPTYNFKETFYKDESDRSFIYARIHISKKENRNE